MHDLISYDLARGLHIIAVIAWIAGLLMLPRFYAYITAAGLGGELEQAMLRAAANVRLIILTPAILLAWTFGIFLLGTYIAPDTPGTFEAAFATLPRWLWIKFALVFGLSAYHGFLFVEGRNLVAGRRRRSERFWQIMSAVPFLVAIAVVLLATLES